MDDTSRRLDDPTRVPYGAADEAVGRSDEMTRSYADSTFGGAPDATSRTAGIEPGMAHQPPDQMDAGEARRTEEIRQEIEQTREEMSETIDALQEKLRPAHIAADAAAHIKQATAEKVKNMTQTAGRATENMMSQTRDSAADLVDDMRQNAIPAAMIGIGAAWWLMNRSRSAGSSTRSWNQGSRSYGSRGYAARGYRTSEDFETGSAGSSLADTWSEAGAGLSQTAEQVGQRAQEYGDRTAAAVRRTTRRAQSQLQRMMQENPLAVGAGALLLGAVIGLAVPETERENEWMGEVRDDVVERARDMARNAASTVQDVAGDAAGDIVSRVVGDQK